MTRLTVYLTFGALFHWLFIGFDFNFHSAWTWAWLLGWPIMLWGTLLGLMIMFAVAVAAVVLILTIPEKLNRVIGQNVFSVRRALDNDAGHVTEVSVQVPARRVSAVGHESENIMSRTQLEALERASREAAEAKKKKNDQLDLLGFSIKHGRNIRIGGRKDED
jgi:hypothetical protein